MSSLSLALAYQRLLQENASLRLLRADLGAVAAAILSTHLGNPGTRLPAEDLYELVESDLEDLRPHVSLSRTARAYCDDWRSAGFLVRRPAVGARGETIELSTEALSALRIFHELDTPQTTVTESRLVSLAAAVRQLAIDTDPDSTRRIAALEEERARIDAEIARVRGGEIDTLDDRRALERVSDVLLQAQNLPADFAGVRARFEELNHELRRSILEVDDSQLSVLDDVFRGVDLIESSDEGRTFTAFSALIRDAERSAALEDDINAVLDREFVEQLSPESRRALRMLVRDLKRGSNDVQEVLTEFARGLRRYVFSQEFQRDRVLRGALQEALAAALPASREVRPFTPLDLEVELSSLKMASIGEAHVHDPSDFDTGETLSDAESSTVDFASLARLARKTEIDFAELISNVNESLSQSEVASVGEVLARHPATQGLASVIGLVSLAAEQGQADSSETEVLRWVGPDGVRRTAIVEKHLFVRRIT